jgi:two-component system cell cycle sensor histidine kinase/response regulator CckA
MPSRESLRDRLGRLITSDVFVFEAPDRIRRTLTYILTALLVGSSAITSYALVIGWMNTFRTALAATIAFALVAAPLRLGYPRLTGIIMILCLLAVVTQGILTGDGIHDVAIAIYPVVFILGTLLLNTRFFVVLSLLVIACVAGVGVLELRGIVTNKFSGAFGYPDIVFVVVILATEAVVIRLLATVISSSLVRAHRSERSYRGIFNATSEAIFVLDAEVTAILDANETALRMFGYMREELLSLPLEELVPDEIRLQEPRKREIVEETLRDGTSSREWVLKRKDRTRFWAEVALRIAEIDGQTRFLAVVRDVDARKGMEERLRQSEKLEAVGQLAGGIAHDFNNQLAGIVGYADLVRSDLKDGTDLANNVDRILVAAKRAADLTGQLLAFARRGKYQSAAVDVNVLVEEVLSLLRHSVDKRIEVRQELTARPSLTLGDASQLQSAILNLAINARDAMPEGGAVTVATRLRELEEGDGRSESEDLPPGNYVEVEVTDTGTGIDADTQRRVFEPFFTTKPMGKGTGMGLAAVYGTVKNHGGTIAVESERGRGSTFRLLLPLYEGPVLPDEQGALPRPERAARVLVVDDEEEVCRVTSRMLTRMGHTAFVRQEGKAAVEFYREAWRDLDLVVLDMSMPKMSGRETFTALRRINPDAIIVLTSGFTFDDDVRSLIDSGARGFIQKPFDAEEFTRVVAEALQQAAPRRIPEHENR